MEFTPINFLDYVATLKLPLNIPPIELGKSRIRDIESSLLSEKDDRDSPLNCLEQLKSFDPIGLTLGDLGISLDTIMATCQNLGMEFGVELKGGGRYFGDIVELSGPDVGGRTTRATAALINRIQRITENYSQSLSSNFRQII